MNRRETDYRPNFGFPRKEFPSIKKSLYKIAGGRCQYFKGCDETDINKLTVAHIVSRRTAWILGWGKKRVNASSNLRLLCWPHHLLEDRDNASRTKKEIIEIGDDIAA